MRFTPLLYTSSTLLLMLLAGCTVGPDYKGPPQRDMPGTFGSLAGADVDKANPAIKPGSAASLSAHDLAAWWKSFNDPVLDSLIERAITSNLDLRIAEARVREARALRGIDAAGLYPRVDASGGVSRRRDSDSVNSGFSSNGPRNLFEAGVDASWEIDVFGGVRRAVEAADATLAGAQESRRDALVTLVAEVARNYAELRGFQQRIDLNQQTIKAQRDTLDLTQSLSRAGISSDLQVQQSASDLASRESQLPPLLTGARQSAHRLGVLLGQQPGALLEELANEPDGGTRAGTIPRPPAEVPIGLPSDLLRRRPDIRRAERNIAAATARIGVATSDLFPKFSITGGFGLQSQNADTFFNMDSRTWYIGPSVRWNVFDAKRIRYQIKAANAREEQAVAEYERGVLTAMEDVENALTSFIQEQARRRSLGSAVDFSKRALDLATDRYKSGIGDFLNVLDAQRVLYELQDLLVQSEIGVTRSLISVYKALGGGWEEQMANGK